MQTEPRAKRPRTASREVRRRQLIEATITSIADHGISGTTMASVTGLAGLSMGIVGFHFQNKENLFRETLIFLADEHRDCWQRRLDVCDQTPAAKLEAIIAAAFDPQICTHQRIAVWFGFFGERRYRESYRERITEYDMERKQILCDVCTDLAAAEPGDDIDPLAIAEALECFSDGLWLSLILYPEYVSPDAAQGHIRLYLERIFPASFPATPKGAGPTACEA